MKLFSNNGHTIEIGDVVETFKGIEVTVTGWAPPHKPGSTGYVFVEYATGETATYYPSVIDAKFIKEG